ncbi:MAG: ABC transporter ATP-binding protein/permease [Gammaproteobacteria bacterium]|nr:ABC transporter ATP-binding protein/permease [Gammaproteobacteria bacterium]
MPNQSYNPSTAISWQWIRSIAFEHKRELVIAHIVALLGTVASVPIPLLMPLLVDEVLLNQPGFIVNTMNPLFPEGWHGPVLYIGGTLALTLLLRFFALITTVWQTRHFVCIAKDVTYRIRQRMLLHLQKIAMSAYETKGSGTITSHFVTDVNAIDQFIGETTSKFLIALLTVIGTTIVLLIMHWQLALIILFMNPVVIWVTLQFGKRVKDLKKQENSAFEVFQQTLSDTLEAIQQIRASNREKHYISRAIDHAREVRNHSTAFSWKSDAANRLSFVIFLFGFDCFRAISMLMVVFSDLSIGQMMAVFGYLWFMMSPVQELLNIQYALFGAKAALVRINDLLATEQEPHYPHLHNPFTDKNTVDVHIENAIFAYGDSADVLNGVTLDIKAGEKIALVGASGGGKSTLVQVLLGLYPLKSGTLKFGGIPVNEIGLEVVREHVATVLQHPALFNDTVRMNLTLGREQPDENLWQALEIAQLADTIKETDQQLDAVIGHDGVRLSGGQRQRLAIARMILTNPSVVILDEATSALDTHTEARLHQAMQDFLDKRTTIIIAHRLSAVKQADRVYVFEDGHIIEEGSHNELIQANGLYQKLYGHIYQ